MGALATYEEYKQVLDKLRSLTELEHKEIVNLYEINTLRNLATAYEQVKYDFTSNVQNQPADQQSNVGLNQPFQFFL
ncbi:hypothetical protein DHW03_02650 [Pedobacter yonginense]|uniref:Uncharacterized protein n=1 Tax=Pedobacter yonginense TaxID=651869 RepID=A0A317ESH8_9SPHI|nr:hypothetical protein [Pedobacter yonginense]PWS28759.1 hypothetical protein DHW03_02650 [Pedobacter yonginense]